MYWVNISAVPSVGKNLNYGFKLSLRNIIISLELNLIIASEKNVMKLLGINGGKNYGNSL